MAGLWGMKRTYRKRSRGSVSSVEPANDVEDVHRGEGLEVRLGAVRPLVGAEPERLHGRHPQPCGAGDVVVEAVADEERARRLDVELLERPLEDQRMGLPLADLGGEQRDVEPLGDAHPLEVPPEQSAGVEGVRDEAELEPASPERLE